MAKVSLQKEQLQMRRLQFQQKHQCAPSLQLRRLPIIKNIY